ncbi:MAG: hypothetical protein J7K30_10960 [Deltaproteobacteria bacterium]|nr:hypothetical protein [Deltaproteobacteria bacterium]
MSEQISPIRSLEMGLFSIFVIWLSGFPSHISTTSFISIKRLSQEFVQNIRLCFTILLDP